MTDAASVTIAGLPRPLRPLRPLGPTESWSKTDAAGVAISAGPRTDWFIDPGGDTVVNDAPALLMPTTGNWMFSALVSARHAATFDAAVLVVHHDDRTWAKLCLERSPQGAVMIVSVVTRGTSDDCNAIVVDQPEIHLRISRWPRTYAFHYSSDGAYWHLVRYFSLGSHAEPQVGLLAQSPTGSGCTAGFRDIRFEPAALADLRSGV